MLSLKEFKEFNLSAVKTKNVIGGNVIYTTNIQTDTGLYIRYDEYTDDGKFVKTWTEGPPIKPGPNGGEK